MLYTVPLFIDLIRDLGTRKEEKEQNIEMELISNSNHDEYFSLIEYE